MNISTSPRSLQLQIMFALLKELLCIQEGYACKNALKIKKQYADIGCYYDSKVIV